MKSLFGSQFYTAGRLLIAATLIFGLLLAIPGHRTRADSPGFALAFDGVNDSVRLAATAQMLASTWKNTKTVSCGSNPKVRQ